MRRGRPALTGAAVENRLELFSKVQIGNLDPLVGPGFLSPSRRRRLLQWAVDPLNGLQACWFAQPLCVDWAPATPLHGPPRCQRPKCTRLNSTLRN